MKVVFYKYQGSGNDFIIIENRKAKFSKGQSELYARMCNRRFGVGADGLILVQDHPECDFEMIYFNADGLEGSMCGNGGRCVVSFMQKSDVIDQSAKFAAFDGIHEAQILPKGIVKIKMADIKEVAIRGDHYLLDTGSPHYVTFVNDVSAIDVVKAGREIRYNEKFREQGINVNYVQETDGAIIVRTYERGVENETLSCGTGVVSAAICKSLKDEAALGETETLVKTSGGELTVAYNNISDGIFSDVWLQGPAEFVYKGEFEV